MPPRSSTDNKTATTLPHLLAAYSLPAVFTREHDVIEEYFDNKFDLRDQLIRTFSRPVDLLTWKSIRNSYILQEVEAEHIELYAA